MLVYRKCECFVMQMLYLSCGSSQCCMTCSLLMLVDDARGNHMEEAYSRAGLITFATLQDEMDHAVIYHSK